jgi:hypothetical protein
MPNISTLTLETMRSSTKTQIITNIRDYLTANMTKKQLITFLLDRDTVDDTQVVTYLPDGQVDKIVDWKRDAETNNKISGVVTNFSYYPTGEINVIRVSQRNADNVETSHVRIKHYLDGRQPKITESDD